MNILRTRAILILTAILVFGVLGACRTYVCVLKSTLQNARYRVFIQI